MIRIIVVGGGAAGIAAAQGALEFGADRVDIIDRNERMGGILRQCIHDGFGVSKYRRVMTGPEYANRVLAELCEDKRLHQRTLSSVTDIKKNETGYLVRIQSPEGIEWQQADSVVFATGCRERTRGMLMIPGSRPAGVYTAGLAQKLVNVQNVLPGKRVIILGSGDIGLIMARRFHLEGAKVVAVLEVMKDSGGLSRNIRQCLQDFEIPLLTGCTVSKIIGKERVEAVEICDVDEKMEFIKETARQVECDTLVLSVGLIPENDVLAKSGAYVDKKTQIVQTDEYLQTALDGIFSCGNSRYVHDLVDRVSEEGYTAGKNAVAYVKGRKLEEFCDNVSIDAVKGIPKQDAVFCVLCPNGCNIKVARDNNGQVVVSGNKCTKGIQFAKQEIKNPKRIVTTTVTCDDGRLIPVKSSELIPIGLIREYVKRCSKIVVSKEELESNEIVIDSMPNAILCR